MDTLPSKETFEMIQSLSYEKIVNLSNSQARLILLCLVRMSLCDTLDVSKRCAVNVRKRLKLKLLGFVEVNELRNLLDFNLGELEVEVKKEMQLSSKTFADGTTSSILLAKEPQFNSGVMKAFEVVDPKIRIKIVLSELIQLINAVRNSQGFINEPFTSELFDSEIYFFDILDLLYFSISEMLNTFQLIEVVEALLLLKKGLNMICCLIANLPESFHEICMSLITNCSNTEDESFHSANCVRVLRKLCQMNPNEALLIRDEAVELCRMPNLVVMLTLDHIKQSEVAASTTPVAKNSKKSTPMSSNTNLTNSKADVLSFITGILLSNDDRVRNWFANYFKSSQRKSSSGSTSVFGNSFFDFRAVLLNRFKAEQVAALSESTSNTSSTESELILTEACIMLRLYCALRGAASIKYTDEETVAICRMIICRPRHGYIGVRFVSFGLCMILAFPQMVTACESESKVIDWICWLVQEESYLGKVAGKVLIWRDAPSDRHSLSQEPISGIGELVSPTVGIKLPVSLDLNGSMLLTSGSTVRLGFKTDICWQLFSEDLKLRKGMSYKRVIIKIHCVETCYEQGASAKKHLSGEMMLSMIFLKSEVRPILTYTWTLNNHLKMLKSKLKRPGKHCGSFKLLWMLFALQFKEHMMHFKLTWKEVMCQIEALFFNFLRPFMPPAIEVILLFYACIGLNLHSIPVAVYDGDQSAFSQRILRTLNSDVIKQTVFNSSEDAIEAVRHGFASTALTMCGFSNYLFDRMMIMGQEIELAVLHNSTIHLRPTCSINHLMQEPVYGLKNSIYRDYMAPGSILSIAFLSAILLTAMVLVVKRKQGLIERSIVAGANYLLIPQIIILFVSSLALTIFIFPVSDLYYHGEFALILLLTFLQSIFNISFSVLVWTLAKDENSATMIALGFFCPDLLSNIIWPIETMSLA